MKHYTKTLAATALITSTLLSGAAFADSTKATVINKDGVAVKSIYSGQCVRTKWTDGSDACASVKAAPAPRHAKSKMFTSEPKRSYIVFFDFNSSQLTADAKDILRNLFEATGSAKTVEFDLTGHADRVGSDAYNLMISEKRALSVKNQLVKLGANSGNVDVNWKGESDPLVQTKDGIQEPQNRRTEIRVTTKTPSKQ